MRRRRLLRRKQKRKERGNMKTNTDGNIAVALMRKLAAAASVATWALRIPGVEETCHVLGLLGLDPACRLRDEETKPKGGAACCACC